MTTQTPYRRPEDSFESFRRSIEKGETARVYLLHGNEPLLIDRATEMIGRIAAGGDPSGMNRQVFGGEESESREVALAAAAYPMLGKERLVIVKDAEKLGDTGPLEAYVRDPSPATILVVISPKPDFRQKLFQALKEKALLVECRTPYDDRIGAWIEAEVRSAGKSIEPEGVELLRLSVGSSLADLSHELEKLSLFMGERKAIGAADVAAVVGVSRRFSVFDLQRSLGELNTRDALAVIEGMIDSGENMTRCVAQITKYFEKLWLLPPAGIGRDEAAALLGVKPFFVREYLAARRNFSSGRLDDCFMALREADLALKSSGGIPRRIMTLLIYDITRNSARAAGEQLHPAAGITGEV
ncbi:MAG TPA: DNA polymerase III subunit delta [Bacteroidota bacterium]|nr:DNA polymerase III subunit delta [Bacteroidota bacterium]